MLRVRHAGGVGHGQHGTWEKQALLLYTSPQHASLCWLHVWSSIGRCTTCQEQPVGTRVHGHPSIGEIPYDLRSARTLGLEVPFLSPSEAECAKAVKISVEGVQTRGRGTGQITRETQSWDNN